MAMFTPRPAHISPSDGQASGSMPIRSSTRPTGQNATRLNRPTRPRKSGIEMRSSDPMRIFKSVTYSA